MRTLVVVLLLMACSAWGACPDGAGAEGAGTPTVEPRAADAGAKNGPVEPVDDNKIVRKLEKEAAKLIEAGRTVKIAALIEQLQTKKCTVRLAAPPLERVPPEALYERAKASVMIVSGVYKCGKCSKWHVSPAGGYAISSAGVCVTNYHVVNAPKWETLIAMTPDGRILPVKKVLAASQADDVAIIQVDADNLVPAALAPDAPVGSRVRVLHHPDGRFYTLTEGMVARYFTSHKNGRPTLMAITADYAKGSSGSPVFDDRGAVVGMVASTVSIYYDEKEGRKENLQMVVKECVPAASILKLIERQ